MIGDVLPRERASSLGSHVGGAESTALPLQNMEISQPKDVFDSGKETLQAGFFTPQRAPPTHPTHFYQTFYIDSF